MKKVLIVTYYWPPSGGAGVQRWMRFVKNLRDFGWEPVIYTASEDTLYPIFDQKLLTEIPEGVVVHRQKVPEPNNFLKRLYFWKKDKNKAVYSNQEQKGNSISFIQKSLWFIRGNFFIPDARCFWVKPSVNYLEKLLQKEQFDAIVSTGPPHSMHLIALALKRKFNIPWIADFRDPWTSMDYLKKMYLSKYAWKQQEKMEAATINESDQVVVVGKTMYNEFKEKYNIDSAIIHNGYNEFTTATDQIELDKKFTILHMGSFLLNRNCADLWETLSNLLKKDSQFANHLEIRLVGNVAPNVLESIEHFGLNPYLNKIAYVPYEKSLEYLVAAQVLLLPVDRIENAEFILTGKLFEYLKAKRPILLLAPSHGDAADIIKQCNAGYCCDFDDLNSIEESVQTMFNKFLKGENEVKSTGYEQFSSSELTKKMVGILDQISSN